MPTKHKSQDQGSFGKKFGSLAFRTSFGPAAVPEVSATVSFGLLLAFGIGGIAITARKKKAAASA